MPIPNNHNPVAQMVMSHCTLIPVGTAKYIIVKGGKVVRTARCCGAVKARLKLKPKRGETLYIQVGAE